MTSKTSRSALNLAAALGVVAGCLPTWVGAQQIAPSGYTGAINTPTTGVLAEGSMGMALTNSIPEAVPRFPGVGGFGGLNLGFGLLPGLEAVGRLTFNGDLNCDLYYASCRSDTRDLSVGGKYRLPLEKIWPRHYWLQPGLAVGVSDYGGAATLYRQQFVVGSLSAGPVTVNGGKSTATGGGLMQGLFGSAILRVTDSLSVVGENDTRDYRAGLAWNQRLTGNWDLNLAASRKLSHNSSQQAVQATVGLTYFFGRGDRESAKKPIHREDLFESATAATVAPLASPRSEPSIPLAFSQQSTGQFAPAVPSPRFAKSDLPALGTEGDTQRAQVIAQQFKTHGFSDIDIGRTRTGWVVRAEPRQWRQHRMDAFGAALAAFVQASAQDSLEDAEHVSLIATYMGQPVGGVSVGGELPAVECIRSYLEGQDRCGNQPALNFFFDTREILQADTVQWLVRDAHDRWLMPQFEFSPAAAYTAGTEFGLFDYSIGASLGWEVPLAKGLQWQGFNAKLLTESDDFKNPNSYFRRVGMGEATRSGANLLVYQHPLLPRLWGQVAVGNLGYKTSGRQLNTYWATEDGRYRATWIVGQWHNPEVAFDRHPNILNLGVRPFSSNFQLTYSAGRFHNNDTGNRLGASFLFDDYGVQFFWRKTGPSNLLPNRNAYMGFSITLPLGPKRALEAGPTTFRLRDRWELGLETKVGQKDNYIEPGYGSFPGIRHNLDTDVFDFNRADLGLMNTLQYRARVTARELLKAARLDK